MLFALSILVMGCKKPPDGETSAPTTTNIIVYIPFNLEQPKSTTYPYYIDRQINYKAKLFVKTTDASGNNPVNYTGSPYINLVTNTFQSYPVTYNKTVNVPTEGYFNVQVLMEYTECSSSSKMREYEGNSPIIALPVSSVNIQNSVLIYESNC